MKRKDDPRLRHLELVATASTFEGLGTNRPLSDPIIQGSAFTAETASEHAKYFRRKSPTFYQRFGHPNSAAAATKIAALEGAEKGAAFSSGMAAISTTLISLVSSGSHIVAGEQIFDQTERILRHLSASFGLQVDFVDATNPQNIVNAVRENTAAIYLESPSNPRLFLSDIRAIAEIGSKAGIPVLVDNTIATPFGQLPIELGASIVLHSGTKLLSGHMDVMCGFAVGDAAYIDPILQLQTLLGGVLDPHASWLTLRGVKTLALRSARIFDSACRVANFLAASPTVESVFYPLDKNHPQFELAKRQMLGGGCLVSFKIAGGSRPARRFMDSLKAIHIATSLGGIESVLELPYELDWSTRGDDPASDKLPEECRGLIRLSVGIEPAEHLIADLEQALSRL